MKVFLTLKDHIEFLTGYNVETVQKSQRLNVRIVMYLILTTTFWVPSLMFTLFKAKTFQEYADSFYVSTTSFCGCTIPGFLIWNIEKLYTFCENFDAAIQKRGESLGTCYNILSFHWKCIHRRCIMSL